MAIAVTSARFTARFASSAIDNRPEELTPDKSRLKATDRSIELTRASRDAKLLETEPTRDVNLFSVNSYEDSRQFFAQLVRSLASIIIPSSVSRKTDRSGAEVTRRNMISKNVKLKLEGSKRGRKFQIDALDSREDSVARI